MVDQRLGNVTLAATSLDLGASATGTLQYTVLEGNQPGTLVNTADASGETPLGSNISQQDSVVVTVPDVTTQIYRVYLPLINR